MYIYSYIYRYVYIILCSIPDIGFATVFAPLVPLTVFMDYACDSNKDHRTHNTQLAHVTLSHASRLFSYLCKFHSAACTLRLLCVWARGQPTNMGRVTLGRNQN